jgi:hypothetical protein
VRARCRAPITPGIPKPRPVSMDRTPATALTCSHQESRPQHCSQCQSCPGTESRGFRPVSPEGRWCRRDTSPDSP